MLTIWKSGCHWARTYCGRCVLVPVAISRGRLTWILEAGIYVKYTKTSTPWASGGASPQAQTLLGGARFITWGLRHFWEQWVCLSYGLVPRPTLKKKGHTHQKIWIKQEFLQAVAMWVLLYGLNTKTIMNCLKKLDENYTRMLCVLNKLWKQHPIKQYSHLQVRWPRLHMDTSVLANKYKLTFSSVWTLDTV